MKIIKVLRPIDWYTSSISCGYACGYVGVPKEHPWYEQDYNNLPVTIHGGLTYGNFGIPETDQPKDIWFVGFDTAHYNDNIFNCDKTYCENELESLYQQALKAINI